MTPRPLALTLVAIAGCHANVSLGGPLDGQKPAQSETPRSCPASDEDSVVATIDPALGELRAIAARDGRVVAAFAGHDGGGIVAVATSTGRAFAELARINAAPTALAFDGTHAYVAGEESDAVYRVRAGQVVAATSQSRVSSITVGASGRAFWSRPSDDAVVSWDFGDGAPELMAMVPRAHSLAERDGTLYITGAGGLAALGPTDAAPARLASVCGLAPLAVDRDAVFCLEAGALHRVGPETRATAVLASGIRGAKDIVAARGRVFFRSETSEGAAIEAVPADGIGGPSIVASIGAGPSALASDGCSLYYSGGGALNRHSL